MDNAIRKDILARAKATGYPGNIVEAFRAYDQGRDLVQEYVQQQQEASQPQMQVAQTPEEQEQGLRPAHAAGQVDQSMAFPNVQPGQSFNTMGMKVPINIDKVDKQGNLVESYKAVPPGLQNLPTGPYEGTVIESPARMKSGGVKRYQTAGLEESTPANLPWLNEKGKPIPFKADPLPQSLEDKVDRYLGYPMVKARVEADPDSGDSNDGYRHSRASQLTAERIKENTGSSIAGVIGANVLGAAHEIAVLPKTIESQGWYHGLRSSAEDMINNAVGSLVGVAPSMSSKTKGSLLEELTNRNMLPDGVSMDKGDMYLKKNKKGGVRKYQTAGLEEDKRTLESGTIVDKGTNTLNIVKGGKITQTFPVLTGQAGKNPKTDVNKNVGSLDDLETNSAARSTPTGIYMMAPNPNVYGWPGYDLNPIPAFGQPAPEANDTAIHITYGASPKPGANLEGHPDPAEFIRRNAAYKQGSNKRYLSYGCTNAQGEAINCLEQSFPQGDTAVYIDSRSERDSRFFNRFRNQEAPAPAREEAPIVAQRPEEQPEERPVRYSFDPEFGTVVSSPIEVTPTTGKKKIKGKAKKRETGGPDTNQEVAMYEWRSGLPEDSRKRYFIGGLKNRVLYNKAKYKR